MRTVFRSLCTFLFLILAVPAHATFIFPEFSHFNGGYTKPTSAFQEHPTGKTYLKANKIDWGVSFQYPDNWEYQDIAEWPATYVFVRPSKGMTLASLRDSAVVVRKQALPAPLTIGELHKNFMVSTGSLPSLTGSWNEYIPGFKLLSSGSTVLAGHPALSYTFTADNGKPFSVHLVVTAFDRTRLDTYLITSSDYFGEDNKIFEAMLPTFSVSTVVTPTRPTAVDKFVKKFSSSSSSSKSIVQRKSSFSYTRVIPKKSSSSSARKMMRPPMKKK